MQPRINPGLYTNFLFFSFSLASCVLTSEPHIVPESRQKENVYFVPASINQPLIREKNEFSFSAQRSSSSKHVAGDLQAAFMPGKHIGVMASFNGGKGYGNESLEFNRVEAGVGYVVPLNKLLHLETYSGIAQGKIANRHHTGTSDIKINSAFIQPTAVIINYNKTVRFAFVSKFSVNTFDILNQQFETEREPFSSNQLLFVRDNPVRIFWEPGLTFRFGWKDFLFHSGFSYTADLSKDEIYRAKGNLSLGVAFVAKAGSKKQPLQQ